MTTTA